MTMNTGSIDYALVRAAIDDAEATRDPLATLSSLDAAQRRLAELLRVEVRAARLMGHTLEAIAQQLHVTRQAVWLRFEQPAARERRRLKAAASRS